MHNHNLTTQYGYEVYLHPIRSVSSLKTRTPERRIVVVYKLLKSYFAETINHPDDGTFPQSIKMNTAFLLGELKKKVTNRRKMDGIGNALFHTVAVFHRTSAEVTT